MLNLIPRIYMSRLRQGQPRAPALMFLVLKVIMKGSILLLQRRMLEMNQFRLRILVIDTNLNV